ncbi:MAG: hypothetical protein WBY84_02815, partial [Pseudolabrys sp.]
DVGDLFAVNENLPAVVQRFEILSPGSHRKSLSSRIDNFRHHGVANSVSAAFAMIRISEYPAGSSIDRLHQLR